MYISDKELENHYSANYYGDGLDYFDPPFTEDEIDELIDEILDESEEEYGL